MSGCHHEPNLRALLSQLIAMPTTTVPTVPTVQNYAIQILSTHGMHRIAVRLCGELNLNTMQDLARLTDARVDGIE
jgi:hypothetical protein